ncbi:MAG: hypothetical protein KKH12_12325 [Gammaproteobacteria bacterium]|nr:hypothetical protein [Gammaproteobacteria bacterium]MBU1482440.1 hypothetical protein [Gammaproteobacteria bacterium]
MNYEEGIFGNDLIAPIQAIYELADRKVMMALHRGSGLRSFSCHRIDILE